MDDCKQLSIVAKTLTDKNLVFYANQILGCLYLHLEMTDEARRVFDLLKDIAEEARNWSQAMQTYSWIGRCL